MAEPVRSIASVRPSPASPQQSVDMMVLFIPDGVGLMAEMKRVGIPLTPEILAVITGYAAQRHHDGLGKKVPGGLEVAVPTQQLLADQQRWQRYVAAFAARGNDRWAGTLPRVRMPIAERPITGSRVAIERPPADKLTLPEQRWMWNRNRVEAAVRRDFANAGLPERLLLVPAEGIEKEQLERLETMRPSRESLAAYDAQRVAAVKALRAESKRTGNAAYGKVAGYLEAQKAPKSLLELKHLLDVMFRSEDASQFENSKPVDKIVNHHQDLPITEAYFSFEHDAVSMRGTAPDGTPFEPSGYRIKWCDTQPDASGNCTAVKTEDWPYSDPFARDGRYYLHFAEQNSTLDGQRQYWVHATAYNALAESGPSVAVSSPFPAAQRGDLNKNGRFDSGDVNAMLAQLLDTTHPRVLADIDKDGAVTQHDLDRLLELVAAQQP